MWVLVQFAILQIFLVQLCFFSCFMARNPFFDIWYLYFYLGLILQGHLIPAIEFVYRHHDCFFDIALLSTVSKLPPSVLILQCIILSNSIPNAIMLLLFPPLTSKAKTLIPPSFTISLKKFITLLDYTGGNS